MRQGLVDVQKNNRALDLERQIHRKWKAGDVYAPHDLSSVEMQKWRKIRPRERDAFDQLGINPLHEYKVCKVVLG
jgi:small subunit ribosomal protein S18